MRMKYPLIVGNTICDGLVHEILPTTLESFVYNGVLLYYFNYYDLDHGTYAGTFLRVDQNGNYYKVPLLDYPDPQFFERIQLVPVPLPPDGITIQSDRPYRNIGEYCGLQHIDTKKPSSATLNAQRASAPEPPPPWNSRNLTINPPTGSDHQRISMTDTSSSNFREEEYSGGMSAVALGYPNSKTIEFYNASKVEDVVANFDGCPQAEYLIGELKQPIYTLTCNNYNEYYDALGKIRSGDFNITLPFNQDYDFWVRNSNNRQVGDQSRVSYSVRYLCDNYSYEFLFQPFHARHDGKVQELNFISNHYWDVDRQDYNHGIDRNFKGHLSRTLNVLGLRLDLSNEETKGGRIR